MLLYHTYLEDYSCFGSFVSMLRCYEFFNCKEMDCVRRKTEKYQCWEINNTLCQSQYDYQKNIQIATDNNKSSCELCPYYKSLTKYKSITGRHLNILNQTDPSSATKK